MTIISRNNLLLTTTNAGLVLDVWDAYSCTVIMI